MFASFTNPVYSGLELDLFSFSRGLFVYSPILAVGVMGYLDALRSKGNKRETFLLLGMFLCILLPYSAWYQPDGGVAFGPRFLVAAIPFLLLPAGYVLESISRKALWCVYATLTAGIVINGLGALVSAIPPQTPSNVSPLTNTIIPRLLVGNLNVWWIGDIGNYWPIAAFTLIGFAAVVPVAWYEIIRQRELVITGTDSAAAPIRDLGGKRSTSE